jgi:LPXTG-motif cell wall-anchored protein
MQSILKGCPLRAIPGQVCLTRLLSAAAVVVLLSVGFAGPASAQYVTPEPPSHGTSTDAPASPVLDASSTDAGDARSVAGAGGATGQVASRSNGPGLPVTGGDVLGLTAIGFGAIAAGGLVLHLRRRATRI